MPLLFKNDYHLCTQSSQSMLYISLLSSGVRGLFNMQKVSEVNYIFFGDPLCWNLFHLKKTLRSCLHPGIHSLLVTVS